MKDRGRLIVALLPLSLLAGELVIGIGLEVRFFGGPHLIAKVPLALLLVWAFRAASRQGPPAPLALDVPATRRGAASTRSSTVGGASAAVRCGSERLG